MNVYSIAVTIVHLRLPVQSVSTQASYVYKVKIERTFAVVAPWRDVTILLGSLAVPTVYAQSPT